MAVIASTSTPTPDAAPVEEPGDLAEPGGADPPAPGEGPRAPGPARARRSRAALRELIATDPLRDATAPAGRGDPIAGRRPDAADDGHGPASPTARSTAERGRRRRARPRSATAAGRRSRLGVARPTGRPSPTGRPGPGRRRCSTTSWPSRSSLSADERYLCGHYLAYLLGGSRRKGFFRRRPLDPLNADRARLMLAMTWLMIAGAGDEAHRPGRRAARGAARRPPGAQPDRRDQVPGQPRHARQAQGVPPGPQAAPGGQRLRPEADDRRRRACSTPA